MMFLQLIDVSKEDYLEYMRCKNDEEIKAFVLKDALSGGCEFIEERRE